MNDRLDELVDLIPDWVAMTRGTRVFRGLSRGDAIRRAERLREAIRGGRALPAEDVVLTNDSKEVLHALVFLLESSANDAESRFVEAGRICFFLQSVEWGDDLLGEKVRLLRDCTEIARRAAGCDAAAGDSRADSREEDEREVFSALQAGAFDEQGRRAAAEYFAVPLDQRTADFTAKYLSDPNVLPAVCGLLRDERDKAPLKVAGEASVLYRFLRTRGPSDPNERYSRIAAGERGGLTPTWDYFLGETAYLAGCSCRDLGEYGDAERWLDFADAGFRHTLNAAPALAKVAYERLCLRYAMSRYEDVLALLPSLVRSFQELQMERELVKCRFLEAMTLKVCGRTEESFARFRALREAASRAEPATFGQVLLELGEHHAAEGRYAQAMAFYQKALSALENANRPGALANLKWSVGETFRIQGKFSLALAAFGEALNDFSALGSAAYVAYVRLAIAETLLAIGRHEDAGAEILAALPTIEEQKMVPEGLAAVAILRESLRRRDADPAALRELREQIQSQS